MVETRIRELEWPEDEKAKYADDHSRGWDTELGELREYVSGRVRTSAR